MFTVWGNSEKFCDGLNRRNFLKIGAFGAGLTLADLLRGQAKAQGQRQKSAIMIYLPGGPSHMDMYDLKPDAPKEFKGEFNPISTNVPGCQISEYFPMQARMWDKLAAIRSIISVDEHSDSLVTTGYSENVNRVAQHPSFGAVISKLRGKSADIPPFVSLRGMSRGTEPGYLGISHRPFTPDGQGLQNLSLASGVSMERLEDRKQLLGSFDSIRRDIDASGTMTGLDTFTSRAFDMVASGAVRNALDTQKEDVKTRERYKNLEQFLRARRLVEAGVGCITLGYGGWDTHQNNFTTLKRQLPELDRGIANLVTDLDERGLLEDTIVVVWGEFGRTPKVNNGAGRDHWSPVMSAMVAGGGLKTGQMVGTSTDKGERPKDRPYTVQQVLSTFYGKMGIDPSHTFLNGSGRPMYILDQRDPVVELV
jgi:hypothetical protein